MNDEKVSEVVDEIRDAVDDYCTIFRTPYGLAPNLTLAVRAASLIPAAQPREVCTAEELDALPVETVVLNSNGTAWQKRGDHDRWYVVGSNGGASSVAYLPATVLYAPAKEAVQ